MGRNLWIKQLRREDGDLLDDETELSDIDKENQSPSFRTAKVHEPREINIGGKATIFMGKGDRLVIETPGGGAWGSIEEHDKGVTSNVIDGIKGAMERAARGSLAERAAAQAGFGGF